MLGEAAGKMGFKGLGGVGDEGRAPGTGVEGVVDVPVKAELRNRAGESRSPYVSFFFFVLVGDAEDWLTDWLGR